MSKTVNIEVTVDTSDLEHLEALLEDLEIELSWRLVFEADDVEPEEHSLAEVAAWLGELVSFDCELTTRTWSANDDNRAVFLLGSDGGNGHDYARDAIKEAKDEGDELAAWLLAGPTWTVSVGTFSYIALGEVEGDHMEMMDLLD